MHPWSIFFDISSIKRLGRSRGTEDYIPQYMCTPRYLSNIGIYIFDPFDIFATLFFYTGLLLGGHVCTLPLSYVKLSAMIG